MKLEHIALNINSEKEIELFYKQILGMKEIRNFVLKETLSAKIFDIPSKTTVYQLNKDDLMLEIFVNQNQINLGFNHICFKINDREELISKTIAANYECIQIKRDQSDLVFIKDKSGNIFEIKDAG